MGSFLDSMPGIMKSAFSSTFRPATLRRHSRGVGGTTYDPAPSTTKSYPCRAIHDEWGSSYRTGNLVKARDWKVLVLAATLDVEPQDNDTIELEGVTLTVYSDGGQPAVTSDPAKATWTLRCRS